jgi:hypothetical protein
VRGWPKYSRRSPSILPSSAPARLQAQLRELYERDRAVRGEWIAGGRNGPTPGTAADTARLNDHIVAMQDEFAAAKTTLPAKEVAHRAAVSLVQAAQGERASAIAEVAVEVCADLACRFTGALNAALTVEAMVRSVTAPRRARVSALSARAGSEAAPTASRSAQTRTRGPKDGPPSRCRL